MAQLVTVIEQPGPLPISATTKIETDGPTIVTLAGSVWAPNENQMIGVALTIDGTVVKGARIFANSSAMHLAVVPVTFSYTFPWTETQEHVFELIELSEATTSDGNDFFVVTVEY